MYGEYQQPNKAPRRNSSGRYPLTSESEDDDNRKERTRTAGEGHERAEKMKRAKETREREDSQTKHGKKEWGQRNWNECPSSEESGDEEDYEWAREPRKREDETKGHREAGDRVYSQAKEKEEREWLTELQPRLGKLLRLQNKIETMEANIKDMQREDAEILENERRLRNRSAYRTSTWDQTTDNEETEQERKGAERLQARTSERIELGWAEKKLNQCKDDYKMFLSLQSRQRREMAERVEATLRAETDYYAQQEACQEWEIKNKERRREAEARQREVEREHDERESARKETRRAELRDTQKDEAIRRQHVLEKINKQKQETLRQESRSPHFSRPKRNERGPQPSHVETSDSVFAAVPERTRSRRSPRSRNH